MPVSVHFIADFSIFLSSVADIVDIPLCIPQTKKTVFHFAVSLCAADGE